MVTAVIAGMSEKDFCGILALELGILRASWNSEKGIADSGKDERIQVCVLRGVWIGLLLSGMGVRLQR